ncbi:MAG TPA: hypothetical protein VFY39_10195, partial [Gammaproteobacteria bacterium]|nr:hypothetical protein [Gammaproteobacteria bacterium]
DALKNYVYTEDVPQQSKWAITLGDANIAMLKPLFSTMFASVQQVQKVPLTGTEAAGIDGVIRPELEKFEFEVPTGDKPNQFVEVWVQFKLTLFQPDGKVVAEWPVSGYGKAELLGRAQDAVDKAAIVALRDAGAAISTRFAAQPDVSRWLQERRNVPLSAARGS